MGSRVKRYHETQEEKRSTSRTETNSRLYSDLKPKNNFKDITNLDDERVVINRRGMKKNREKYHAEVALDEILKTEKPEPRQNLSDLFKSEEVLEKSNINQILKEAKENRQNYDDKESKRKLKNEHYNILTNLTKEEITKFAKNKTTSVNENEELQELLNTLTEINIRQKIAEKTSELELLNDLLPDGDETTNLPTPKPQKRISDTFVTEPHYIDHSFYTRSMDLSDKDFIDETFATKTISPFKSFLKILLIILLIIGIAIAVYFYYIKFF